MLHSMELLLLVVKRVEAAEEVEVGCPPFVQQTTLVVVVLEEVEESETMASLHRSPGPLSVY